MSVLDIIGQTRRSMVRLRHLSDNALAEDELEKLAREIETGIQKLASVEPANPADSIQIMKFFASCIDEIFDDLTLAKSYARIVLKHLDQIESLHAAYARIAGALMDGQD